MASVRRLRCPACGSRDPRLLTAYAREQGIKLLVVEDIPNFCTDIPGFNPAVMAPELRKQGFIVKTVDFSKGYDSAIRQTAAIFGKKDKAEDVIKRYHRELEAARAALTMGSKRGSTSPASSSRAEKSSITAG